jgi:hypothetical protein
VDIRKIKKLIEIIEESDIAEIEITEGEESVRINRYSSKFAPAAPIATAFNNAQRIAFFNGLTHFYKGGGTRGSRTVECPHHR